MRVADIQGLGHLTGIGSCDMPEDDGLKILDANMKLIAAVRNAFPALLDELDSKDREIERLNARCAAVERAFKQTGWTCALCRHRQTGPHCHQCDMRTSYYAFEFDEAQFAAKEGN